MLAMQVLRALSAKHQRKEVLDDYLSKCRLERCPAHLAEILQLDA